ncbi:hypothetical protein Syun_015695 [Stephania yunnanensis]|uniref:SMARCC C-terminal domain-containing protein n=1 Tax=Stephania yunnanensis TaxID=152371 RepID=A0AAP0JNW5_9MAGN
MALAVYLAGLVDADMSTASAQSSLKALSEDASGIQLATRHSFILEDPPDNLKNAPASESADVKMLDQDTKKNEGQKEENIQVEDQMLAPDGSDVSKDNIDQEENDKVSNEKQLLSSSNEGEENSLTRKHVDGAVGEKDVNPSHVEESSNPALPVSVEPEPGDQTVPMDVTLTPITVMKSGEVTPITVKNSDEVTPSTVEKNVSPSTAEKEDTLGTVDKPGEVSCADVVRSDEVASPSTLKTPSSSVKESTDTAAAMEFTNCTEVPKAVDKVSDSVSSEDKNSLQTVASNSNTEAGTDTVSHAGDNDAPKLVGSNMPATRDEQVVDRLKRAAVTTLSAAAVKAKILANEEEYQIKKLATFLIDKQLHKLETKMAFFNEMDSKLIRVREQIENSRKKLYQERAHIIATRLGLPAQSSRGMPSSLPASRFAMNYANSAPKPIPRGPIPPSR